MSASRVVRSHPDGASFNVWVVPGARRTEVVGFYGDAVRVRVSAVPEQGKANKAVIALMETTLRCRVRLVAGAGSRRKRLVAIDTTVSDLVAKIDRAAN